MEARCVVETVHLDLDLMFFDISRSGLELVPANGGVNWQQYHLVIPAFLFAAKQRSCIYLFKSPIEFWPRVAGTEYICCNLVTG